MLIPTALQYSVRSERIVVHVPTGATITFPRAQPWRGDGFALCEIGAGAVDTELPNGERYALADVLEGARRLMRARARASAALEAA
jgi:hypothetical protein